MCRRKLRGWRSGGFAGGAGLRSASFGGNPILDFCPGALLEFEELKARLFLRFTEPDDLGVQFEPLPGFGRLDAESNAGKVREWSDRLKCEACFAQVKENAAVVGINIHVGERRQTQAWNAPPLVRAPKFFRIEGC